MFAARNDGFVPFEALLEGPTAVAFVQGDVVATAKKVVDAAKRFPALVLKGGYLDGKVLSAAEAQSLATLESREVMLSKVAGMLKAEMTRAASMFQAIQGRFLGVLEAYKEQLPGEVTEAVEADPPAEAAEAEPAQRRAGSRRRARPGRVQPTPSLPPRRPRGEEPAEEARPPTANHDRRGETPNHTEHQRIKGERYQDKMTAGPSRSVQGHDAARASGSSGVR